MGKGENLNNQIKEDYERGVLDQSTRKSDTHRENKVITLMSVDEAELKLKEYVHSLVYSNSSIPDYLHSEVDFLLDQEIKDDLLLSCKVDILSTLDYSNIKHREIKTIISKKIWDKLGDFKFRWDEHPFFISSLKDLLTT